MIPILNRTVVGYTCRGAFASYESHMYRSEAKLELKEKMFCNGTVVNSLPNKSFYMDSYVYAIVNGVFYIRPFMKKKPYRGDV